MVFLLIFSHDLFEDILLFFGIFWCLFLWLIFLEIINMAQFLQIFRLPFFPLLFLFLYDVVVQCLTVLSN